MLIWSFQDMNKLEKKTISSTGLLRANVSAYPV